MEDLLPTPDPRTTTFADMAERCRSMPPHRRAYFCWLAWTRYSSRSWIHGARFFSLMIG